MYRLTESLQEKAAAQPGSTSKLSLIQASASKPNQPPPSTSGSKPMPDKNPAFEELERRVRAAVEVYSNVHRGTGHYSMITTALYEWARDSIVEHTGFSKKKYTVIFCTPYGSKLLADEVQNQLQRHDYCVISSRDIGLPLGLRAFVLRKSALPRRTPFYTGGSTVKMVSLNSAIWADTPHKFEAGTPSVINTITLAVALQVRRMFGVDCFHRRPMATQTALGADRDELPQSTGRELIEELRKRRLGGNLRVPTADGLKQYLNFDNAASTPTFSPVWDVVTRIWRQPKSTYSTIPEEVRNILADFLDARREKYETIFTSNTTEAINIAARLVGNEYRDGSSLVILNTILEHNSNELPWRTIPGASQIRLSVNDGGYINLDDIDRTLRAYNRDGTFGDKRVRLVAVSGGSNVIGSYSNIQAVSRIAHRYGARVLVDGAQLVAHRKICMEEWDIDYLAFSGHKVYAPFGSGALILKKEHIRIDPNELKRIRTSGEENITGIAALGMAVVLLQRIGMEVIEATEAVLTHRLLSGLSSVPKIELFGTSGSESDPHHQRGGIVSICLKKVPHNLAARKLAEQAGIGVRNGCFCAHLLVKRLLRINPVRIFLANLGLVLLPRFTETILPGLVRISVGLENDEADVDRLIKVVAKIAAGPCSLFNLLPAFTRNGTVFLPRTEVGNRIKAFRTSYMQKVYPSPKERQKEDK